MLMPGDTNPHCVPSLSSVRRGSESSLSSAKKPSGDSRACVFEVKPDAAKAAAMTPFLAACPACSGFVMVPKLHRLPLASDAAMPIARQVACASNLRIRAAATAAPMVPKVEVECHPAM